MCEKGPKGHGFSRTVFVDKEQIIVLSIETVWCCDSRFPMSFDYDWKKPLNLEDVG